MHNTACIAQRAVRSLLLFTLARGHMSRVGSHVISLTFRTDHRIRQFAFEVLESKSGSISLCCSPVEAYLSKLPPFLDQISSLLVGASPLVAIAFCQDPLEGTCLTEGFVLFLFSGGDRDRSGCTLADCLFCSDPDTQICLLPRGFVSFYTSLS